LRLEREEVEVNIFKNGKERKKEIDDNSDESYEWERRRHISRG
jgi:hypothetical protein